MKGFVALENGVVFEGESFGAAGESVGEVVFNTALTGYQEVLTDPSYASQIVTMTYPLIGNYGVNDTDIESGRVQVSGFIVREHCTYPSNFTSRTSIGQYLADNKIIGVSGIDTRALTRQIRITGAMKAVIRGGDANPDDLVAKARAWKGMVGLDAVKGVTCKKAYAWKNENEESKPRFKVVAVDYGVKFNILRILARVGCDVTVVPASLSAAEILAMNPDGVFLSNGPGDPAAVTYAIETLKGLVGKLPIFGICLGHQLIGLALGGSTYKLKFGHRGANHPVKNLLTERIEITSQNHGFCVDVESLKNTGARLTHVNLNDKTCEGIEDESLRLFSVQYHPEASPGPHDSGYLFSRFIDLMDRKR